MKVQSILSFPVDAIHVVIWLRHLVVQLIACLSASGSLG